MDKIDHIVPYIRKTPIDLLPGEVNWVAIPLLQQTHLLPGKSTRGSKWQTHLLPGKPIFIEYWQRCFTAPSLFVKIISTDTDSCESAESCPGAAGFGNGGNRHRQNPFDSLLIHDHYPVPERSEGTEVSKTAVRELSVLA